MHLLLTTENDSQQIVINHWLDKVYFNSEVTGYQLYARPHIILALLPEKENPKAYLSIQPNL